MLGKGLGAVWSVLLAISRAPSCVLFPPMKPLAWTKMQPGIPLSSDSASSRTPRHSSKILNLETHHTISRNHFTINANTDLNEFITSNSEHNKSAMKPSVITLYKSTLEEQQQKLRVSVWKRFKMTGNATPVLKGVQSRRDTLDSPVAILIRVQHKLNGHVHLHLLLQGKQMLFPRTTALSQQHDLPARIHLHGNNTTDVSLGGLFQKL